MAATAPAGKTVWLYGVQSRCKSTKGACFVVFIELKLDGFKKRELGSEQTGTIVQTMPSETGHCPS
jgi:hypothetical protein